MLTEVYKQYEITASAEYHNFTRTWIPKAIITSSSPDKKSGYVSGHVGQFTSQEEAERVALEMGKKWVDEHGTV
jgi:pyruvoyl-dependent arginine decarboxylase (PvlArgDC)